jgi:hypothetical protein
MRNIAYVVTVPHSAAFPVGRRQTTGICAPGLHHVFGFNRRLTNVITKSEQWRYTWRDAFAMKMSCFLVTCPYTENGSFIINNLIYVFTSFHLRMATLPLAEILCCFWSTKRWAKSTKWGFKRLYFYTQLGGCTNIDVSSTFLFFILA